MPGSALKRDHPKVDKPSAIFYKVFSPSQPLVNEYLQGNAPPSGPMRGYVFKYSVKRQCVIAARKG